jgi:hypothetical protein
MYCTVQTGKASRVDIYTVQTGKVGKVGWVEMYVLRMYCTVRKSGRLELYVLYCTVLYVLYSQGKSVGSRCMYRQGMPVD